MNARNFIFAYTLLLFAVVSTGVSQERPPDDAQFVKQSVPKTMVAGKEYEVSITMKNTGKSTWTAAENFRLASLSPADKTMWGGRLYLSDSETVEPSKAKTFKLIVRAPSEPGTYDFQWRMVHENVRLFGEMTPKLEISVSAPRDHK